MIFYEYCIFRYQPSPENCDASKRLDNVNYSAMLDSRLHKKIVQFYCWKLWIKPQFDYSNTIHRPWP